MAAKDSPGVEGGSVAGSVVSRSSGLGGSDIAGIVGLSPHKTQFGVYCDKRGLTDPIEQTERMRMGRILEPVVCQLYSEATGTTPLWFDKTIRHEKEPIVIGTPDARLDEAWQRGFEAKTAGLDQAWRWGAEGDLIPQEYLIQCQWYMLLTGAPAWVIAVLIGGDTFKTFDLVAAPDLQGMLLEAGRRFWRDHIEKQNPPPIDASFAARDYLRKTFPEGVGEPREATVHEAELMSEIVRAKKELKFVTDRTETLQNELKLSIGDAKGLYDPTTQTRASWSTVAEATIQAYERAAYRRLTVKARKED